jgi:hypothetical protein
VSVSDMTSPARVSAIWRGQSVESHTAAAQAVVFGGRLLAAHTTRNSGAGAHARLWPCAKAKRLHVRVVSAHVFLIGLALTHVANQSGGNTDNTIYHSSKHS